MNTARLEAFIFDKMAATRLPGLSIALIKGGEVVYARGFGLADIAKSRCATPQTLYGAASVTKSFVAIAILQLAEKGLLKLSDPVERHLPCPFTSKGEPVRIEHLLTHSSGTPTLGYIEAVLRHAHQIGGCCLPIACARDVMTFAQGAKDEWVEAEPGERWFYLNEGYVLLGEIIAKLSGKPYEQYIRDNILRPLGMSRSFFAEQDVTTDPDVAVPYVLPKDGSPPRAGRYLYNIVSSDGALITNVLDLARYVSMFLGRGKGVLSGESFEAMIKPRVPLPGVPAPQLWGGEGGGGAGEKGGSPRVTYYGVGVNVTDDFLGEPLIGHAGSLIVSSSYVGFMPRSNVGVAVMTNGNGYGMPALGKVALAELLDRDPLELPFIRMENLLKDLSGWYETYHGTLRGKITRDGDFLRLDFPGGDQPPAGAIFVPERLDGPEPKFFTYSEGARLPVQFRRRGDGNIELVWERYKFKRTGPLT
jgi:CubicO group peptidase (beta-lactamase class C family)